MNYLSVAALSIGNNSANLQSLNTLKTKYGQPPIRCFIILAITALIKISTPTHDRTMTALERRGITESENLVAPLRSMLGALYF
jgi:hypothetical protein